MNRDVRNDLFWVVAVFLAVLAFAAPYVVRYLNGL